jgi:hypothetical protein
MKLYSKTETNSIRSLYQHYCNALGYINKNKKEVESLSTVIFANVKENKDISQNYMYTKYLKQPYNYIMFDRYATFKQKELVFCGNYHTFMKFTLLGKHLEFSKKIFSYEDFESFDQFENNIIIWCNLLNIEFNFCHGFK